MTKEIKSIDDIEIGTVEKEETVKEKIEWNQTYVFSNKIIKEFENEKGTSIVIIAIDENKFLTLPKSFTSEYELALANSCHIFRKITSSK